MNNNYLEYAIFSLIKINIIDLIKTKASLTKNFNIPPSDIDNMKMWEYELYISELNQLIKEDNEKQNDDVGGYKLKDIKKYSNPKNYTPPKVQMPTNISLKS